MKRYGLFYRKHIEIPIVTSTNNVYLINDISEITNEFLPTAETYVTIINESSNNILYSIKSDGETTALISGTIIKQ